MIHLDLTNKHAQVLMVILLNHLNHLMISSIVFKRQKTVDLEKYGVVG